MLSREERILGEILMSRGLVARATLEACARALQNAPGSSLLELIEQSGGADRTALQDAAAEARDLDRALAPSFPKDAKLGEFRLLREIGRGGMGIVYEAVQEPLGRRVALKVLPAALAIDERRALRFLREARAAARLYHPGIVPVHASGNAEGVLFFAMELIEGESLAEALLRGPFEPRRAAEITAQVARALAHAHEAGLVHRDIKPENILLGKDGRARVADFGLVQEAWAGSLTLSHHILGTPAFLAPEQARGQEVDARADLYALGAVLYTLLCGFPPYSGEIPSVVIGKLLHEDPPALRARRPEIPVALESICARAMAKRPEERYPSAAAFAEALDAYLSSIPAPAHEPAAAPLSVSPSRTRRFLLLGSGVLGVVAATWIMWALLGRSPGTREEPSTAPALGARLVPTKGDACCAHPTLQECKRLDLDLGTGVDDSARSPGPIPPGREDDDWWVVLDPNGDPVPRPAMVVKPHPRWRELPGTRWISANMFGRNGVYVYEICFCVGHGIRDPILGIGLWGDDFVTALRLNGTPLPIPASSRSCVYADEPCQILMTDASRLVEGRNCLDVEVTNAGGSPTGLEVSANVRGEY